MIAVGTEQAVLDCTDVTTVDIARTVVGCTHIAEAAVRIAGVVAHTAGAARTAAPVCSGTSKSTARPAPSIADRTA